MLLEIEQKFPIDDPAQLHRSLADLGGIFSDPIEQVDIYFAHPCRNFKETDEALRIRQVGGQNFITYKGPKLDAVTKTRREIELPLASGEEGYAQFAELLELLTFRPVYEVRKVRVPGEIAWEERQVHLALDHVAGLGDYLELEIVADSVDLAPAQSCLRSLAESLNLKNSERRGYLDLLMSRSA